ncbi:MAG: restriction endonuclease subunit S [Verrucomicrobiota bacterium]
MNIETFFEKFDQFADAPDSVAKMRELVLEFAVQGKLIKPSSNSEQDRKWITFKAEIQDATIGNDEAQPPPFEIPEHWKWCVLNKVADCRAAAKVSPASIGDKEWVLDLEDIDGTKGQITQFATFAERRSLSTKAAFEPGDVLYGKLRPYLNKVVVAAKPGFCTTEIIPLRPSAFMLPEFLRFYLRSLTFLRYTAQKGYGMKMPRLGTKDLEAAEIPVPPPTEQKRIVAKVDELMALCDRLEAQQQGRETKHAALARASLSRFADAPTPANLNLLFHKSYTIPPADLRKSILTLAVQGKLVPQDPNDGDARNLIDRAMEKRRQSIQSKNLRRKVLDESEQLICDEELPASWCVERLANLVDPENTISYGVLVPGSDVPSGIPFVRVQDLSINAPAKLPNKTIAPEIEKPYARTRLRGGEILLCVVGATIGRLGVAPASWAGANIARAVVRIAPIPELNRDYLLLVLRSSLIQSYFAITTRTLAQPTLNVGAIEQTPIPIPPLAEQRRIVAKVNQLMALVDELETQLAASSATAANLLEAIVAELTTA